VEVDLEVESGIVVSASVPMGSSTGTYEAKEVRDPNENGVATAVHNVNTIIGPALGGFNVYDQKIIDNTMIELDGTENKSRLGANAILAVSVATVKAAAASAGMPVFRYLGGTGTHRIPIPVATVIAGGAFSPSPLPFEDYCFVLSGYPAFSKALKVLVEVRNRLQENLVKTFGFLPEIGGALAPGLRTSEEAFEAMLAVIKETGNDGCIQLGLDIAASEFLSADKDSYLFGDKRFSSEELREYYVQMVNDYPISYLEDPFEEDAFLEFLSIKELIQGVEIVGDDLFASSPARISEGCQAEGRGSSSIKAVKAPATAILIKLNQIGTVSEALKAVKLAREVGLNIAVSVRSQETNDNFVADFAVAVDAMFMKVGSPVRGERNAKYNRLLRIEEELGDDFLFGSSYKANS